MTTADAHAALVDELLDAKVLDVDGSGLGEVTQVLLDDLSGQPTWVRVATGLLLTRHVIVPLHGARLAHGRLILRWSRRKVSQAPQVTVQDRLSPEQERELMAHYGITPPADGRATAETLWPGPEAPDAETGYL